MKIVSFTHPIQESMNVPEIHQECTRIPGMEPGLPGILQEYVGQCKDLASRAAIRSCALSWYTGIASVSTRGVGMIGGELDTTVPKRVVLLAIVP